MTRLNYRSLSLAVGALVLSALSLACSAEPFLSVELVTDLAAGTDHDFDGIYVERSREPLTEPPNCDGDDLFDSKANYVMGARVGNAKRVHSGESWVVRVALCKAHRVVIFRSVRAVIRTDTELRVAIAANCLSVDCDSEGPCDYEVCERSIDCHGGNTAACQDPECGSSRTHLCPEEFRCVAAECLNTGSGNAGLRDAASPADDAGPPDGTTEQEMDAQVTLPDAEAEAEVSVRGETGPGPAASDGEALMDQQVVAEAAADTGDGQVVSEAAADTGDAQPDVTMPPDAGEPFSASNWARVLYVGDALASESLGWVRWWLSQYYFVEMLDAVGGRLAICDFLESAQADRPLASKFVQQIRERKPHLIVMQFWGDALTPCMAGLALGSQAYLDRYKADAEEAVRQIERVAAAAGIPRPKILWTLQGPEPATAQPDRPRALNQIYAELAARSGDRTCDAGGEVSMAVYRWELAKQDRYGWDPFSPCLTYEEDSPDCFYAGQYGWLVRLHRDRSATGGDPFMTDVLFCLDKTEPNFNCASWTPGVPPKSPGSNRYALKTAYDAALWLGLELKK